MTAFQGAGGAMRRQARAGHGRGMRSPLTDEDTADRPQEPSIADFNFIKIDLNEPLYDADGALILWSL